MPRAGSIQYPRRKSDVKYLFYKLVFINCTALDFDYTICRDISEISDYLQLADIDLDDPEANAKVEITGIGMTEREYGDWVAKLEENA